MRRFVTYAVPLACLALLSLLLAPVVLVPRHHGASYFVPVVEGQVYRSRQPNRPDWAWLKDNLHIRTVIDLRYPQDRDPPDPLLLAEPGELVRLGIRHVNLPIHHFIPTPEQIDQFLAVVNDRANQPVLIHCELGRQRTGVMAAVYRMEVQGWPPQRAYEELLTFFKRNESDTAGVRMKEFVLGYQRRISRPAESQPSGAVNDHLRQD